jgi:hypothetical protein
MMTGEQTAGVGMVPPPEPVGPKPASRRRYLFGALALIIVFGGGGFAIAATTIGSTTSPARGASGTHRSRPAPIAQGLVSDVDRANNVFTIASRGSGAVTVHVTASTRFTSPGPTLGASFNDVSTGSTVIVYGTSVSANSVTAGEVIIGGQQGGGFAPGAGRGGFGGGGGNRFGSFATSGTVKSVDKAANRFTVTTRAGADVTVVVNASTTYRSLGGSTGASFASLAVGDRALVSGATAADKSVHATQVLLLPAGGGFGRGAPGGGQSPAVNSGLG